jgi:hypothetical protein
LESTPGFKEVSAGMTFANGKTVLAFDVSPPDFRSVSLLLTETRDGVHFAPSAPLAATSGASFITHAGQHQLYFSASTALGVEPRRAHFSSDGQVTGSVDVLRGLPTNFAEAPRFSSTPQGVLATYRDPDNRVIVQLSADGVQFRAPQVIDSRRGAIPSAKTFADGTIALAYQVMNPDQSFTALTRFSKDGQRWSAPATLSNSSNVHDTTLLSRRDGGLDAYYIHPNPENGEFSIYRRALFSNGRQGREERVTSAATGSAMKPDVVRMADGALLLSWARATGFDPATRLPAGEQREAVRLTGDAPSK